MLTVEPKRMGLKDGQRLLDVGCGPGRHSWAACKMAQCSVYCMDIDGVSLRRAKWMFSEMDKKGESKGTWNLMKGSGMCLPFEDKTFDHVLCSEVLEHVDDVQQVMSELIRVLKDDGVLAVSVPTSRTERVFWRIGKNYSHPGGHIRIFTTKSIKKLLTSNDLHIYEVTHRHGLHSIYWFFRCLFGLDNENHFVSRNYMRFLVWGMKSGNRGYAALESTLDHVIAKSIVLYTRKKPITARPY